MSENIEQHSKETRGFQTEVTQLMDLIIHKLYGNKEIFLRELVSNASDATDKLRFEGLKNNALYENNADLKIKIAFDNQAKTITITDNGLGMTREEAIEHLGTIAKSGTKEFFQSLTGDEAKDRHLIGQFGVGFYSSFIVADKVTVNTRKAGQPLSEGVRWESAGRGDYTVETIDKADRGTEIILHLKPGEEEFLNAMRLQHIVKKYSDHIELPIVMDTEVFPEKSDSDEVKSEEKVFQEEVINRATALWCLPKSQIEDAQYIEFYKHVAHDFEDPLLWSHNKVEGKLEYTSLLYIPARAPFDLWQPNKSRGLKLYVKRVFIMEDAEQFLPHYLRFVRGIIDTNDLPLNVSREILQSNKAVDSIRSALVKRALGMLEELAISDSDKYNQCWDEFGQVLKEGPAEDFANKENIAKLLRFASTHTNEESQRVSLEDYIKRMPEGQDKIYYVAAETFNAAKNSPHLEVFREKGIEVLVLYDRIDEWLMSHLTEFEGKQFNSVARGSLDDLAFAKSDKDESKSVEAVKAEQETLNTEFADTLQKIKTVLAEKVSDVRLTQRLTSSPACIVAQEGQMTSQMERLLRAAGQEVSNKPILELNPKHLLVKRIQAEKEEGFFNDLSQILLNQAILSEGGQLEDPATFVKKFNELLLQVAK